MPVAKLLILIAVFFLTSMISVVTGSTSLITVPVLIAVGIETHVAIATNMLALTFLSAGGSLPFLGKGIINRRRLPLCLILTVAGSVIGALMMLRVPARAVQLTLVAAMIAAIALTLMRRDISLRGIAAPVSLTAKFAGYGATFLLAVYGGSISGGYVTMLTAAFVFFFGMTLLESVATTKIVNFFSSGIATLVFLWQGAANWKLGIVLGLVMFFGALLGGHISMKLSSTWLRRIFVAVLLGMAIKMLWTATSH
ncbi:MAG: sulfite exporter TauE/SafE family protein [Terriglobales bacterium]